LLRCEIRNPILSSVFKKYFLSFEIMADKKILVLFDVDGTLTPARLEIEAPMLECLSRLRALPHVDIGTVGGSDMPKQLEQLGADTLDRFDWAFAENGTVAHRGREPLPSASLVGHLGEENLQELLNTTLAELAKIKLPFKRGNFVEMRRGMLNVSPCGRSVSREERAAFFEFDRTAGVRQQLLETLRAQFGERFGLTFSIGGQISMDIFPTGWDKTYCLRHVADAGYDEIHFFGDKTDPGGNDHEIFVDSRTIGHAVTCPEDTIRDITKLFF
jgi:phosphomannomutase